MGLNPPGWPARDVERHLLIAQAEECGIERRAVPRTWTRTARKH